MQYSGPWTLEKASLEAANYGSLTHGQIWFSYLYEPLNLRITTTTSNSDDVVFNLRTACCADNFRPIAGRSYCLPCGEQEFNPITYFRFSSAALDKDPYPIAKMARWVELHSEYLADPLEEAIHASLLADSFIGLTNEIKQLAASHGKFTGVR